MIEISTLLFTAEPFSWLILEIYHLPSNMFVNQLNFDWIG